ncbi:hypothetical protein C8Q80DRAFT_1152096 [Daedaleopsis nitida]|nr:hypothetical protein C8Q80DRAFT_1152096 [Daedaleopsis nitida]
MSVEHALKCQDILTEIFEYLDSNPAECRDLPVCRRTLAAAARVCQAFSSPALDVLWRYVVETRWLFRVLAPFSRIAPSHTKEWQRTNANGYIFSREVSDEEWNRFEKYTARVQCIYVMPWDVTNIHPDVWAALTHRLTGRGPFLPRLKHLHLAWREDITDEALGHLFSPALTQITFQVLGAPDEVPTAVVEAIRIATSRHCHTLSLYPHYFAALEPQTFPFWELPQLRALRRLGDQTQAYQHIKQLESFPHLTSLATRVETATLPIDVSPLHFSNLADLELRMSSLSAAVRILEGASLSRLRRAKISIDTLHGSPLDQPEETHIPSSVLRVVSALSQEHLRSLHIAIASTGGSRLDIADFLCPLIPARHLCIVELRIGPKLSSHELTVHFRDETLRSLISAWPLLRVFKLVVERSPPLSSSVPTIHTLAAFAEAHPHLRCLHLPHVCIPADVPRKSGDETCPAELTELTLDSLPPLDHGLHELYIGSWGVMNTSASEHKSLQADKHDIGAGMDMQLQTAEQASESPTSVDESVGREGQGHEAAKLNRRVHGQSLHQFAAILDRVFPHLDVRECMRVKTERPGLWPETIISFNHQRLCDLLAGLQKRRGRMYD